MDAFHIKVSCKSFQRKFVESIFGNETPATFCVFFLGGGRGGGGENCRQIPKNKFSKKRTMPQKLNTLSKVTIFRQGSILDVSGFLKC